MIPWAAAAAIRAADGSTRPSVVGVGVVEDSVVVRDDLRVVGATIITAVTGVAVTPDDAFSTARRFSKSLRRISSKTTPDFASA